MKFERRSSLELSPCKCGGDEEGEPGDPCGYMRRFDFWIDRLYSPVILRLRYVVCKMY
jgi:hypothetical protein